MKTFVKNNLNDRLRSDYNTIAEKFDQTRIYLPTELENLVRQVIQLSTESPKTLDLGCGNGRTSQIFPSEANYLGIDISDRLIELAKKRFPGRNFMAIDNIYQKNLIDDDFDLVLCLAVMHHLKGRAEQKKFIRRIFDFVKPNGYILVTVWHPYDKPPGDYIIPFDSAIKRFVHVFSLQELHRLVSEQFKIISINEKRYGRKPITNNLYIIAKKIAS